MKYIGNTKLKWYFGNTKLKSFFHGDDKVWTGASPVSYYEGNVLRATIDVDEGTDVLHPNLSMVKSGYTFVGWALTNGGERVETLVATGEPMSLYAIFVPDTLVISSFTLRKAQYSTGYFVYIENQHRDSRYLSADPWVHISAWGEGPATADSQTFTLDMKEYQNVSFVQKNDANGGFFASFLPINITQSGTYTVGGTIVPGPERSEGAVGCEITLSNPIPWT